MSLVTLTATDLCKSYADNVVLDSVSLVVGSRDRIGVVAPNGAGKSTLLRLLAREEAPDGGRVSLAPPDATVGHLVQEIERDSETVARLLARRTGVAGASALLDLAAMQLAEGNPGADDAYSAALERYLALGAPDFDSRRAQVLASVGLSSAILDSPTDALSGGQAARVALASILLARYDVLCLDEPTNDLDFKGLAQLEEHLAAMSAGAVIVSHDRAFLERTVTSVLELDDHSHRARLFEGGWAAYQRERDAARLHAEERYAEYQRQRAELAARSQREREWAQQGLAKARRADEPDRNIRAFRKAQSEQLAGRARRTERMVERLEVVEKPWDGWELRLELASTQRSGDVVVNLDGAVVTRGSFTLGPVDLHIGWAERLAVLGDNGAGKSTLLGAILGRLPLRAGERRVGPSVVFGELDQARAAFSQHPSLLDGFQRAAGGTITEARGVLAKFGLGEEDVSRAVPSLSPGERTRAALALLVARGTNCLVLDEPTNHLDLPAIEQLEGALAGWNATLLLVTHDRAFLDAVHLDRLVTVAEGRVADEPV